MTKSDLKLTVIKNKEFYFKKIQPRNRLIDSDKTCEYCADNKAKRNGQKYPTCDKPAFAKRKMHGKEKAYCEEHFMHHVGLQRGRDKRCKEKNPEKAAERSLSNNTKRSQRASKKQWAEKINTRCADILKDIEPKLLKCDVMREEFYRYSFFDCLMDSCVPFINEYDLGKEIGIRRVLVLEDVYIPSLDLLISFKRNSVTNYESAYNTQFDENKRLLAVKHPGAIIVSTDIDGSSCCNFNALEFYEFIRNRAKRYSKRKTAVIKYKIDDFILELDRRIAVLKTRIDLFIK